MAESSVIKKLRLKPGQKAVIMNAPQGFVDGLGSLPEGVRIFLEGVDDAEFMLLFVKDKTELDRYFDQALQSIVYDGLFWLAYPKGGSKIKSDLNRDILWKLLSTRGIRPVAMISIDEVWAAMRFRPEQEVGGN